MSTTTFTRREVNLSLLAVALSCVSPVAVPAREPIRLFDFAIAGGWHHGLTDAAGGIVVGERFHLVAEPFNPHDPNALAVHRGGTKLGYVPRVANAPIAALLKSGAAIDARVVGHLRCRRDSDIPADLVFTGFVFGDPLIRLTLNG